MAAARFQDTSRVLPSGRRSVTLTPVPELRVTKADVQDPETLHRFLSHFVAAHKEISRGHRSSPRMRAVILEGVKFTAGQDLAPMHHALGTIVRYQVVRWIGATSATACQYSEVVNDGARLVLHAITSGTADVEVWPV